MATNLSCPTGSFSARRPPFLGRAIDELRIVANQDRPELGDDVPAMRLMGSMLNWVMGLTPIYAFTRETGANRLLELRSVCYTLLDDLGTPASKGLQVRVDSAVGANEFWHMRPRLFDAVSEVHGEGEATQRLLRLDALLRVQHDRRSRFAQGTGAAPGSAPVGRRRRGIDEPSFRTTR